MRPVKTNWTDRELKAPKGMEDECDSLPIMNAAGVLYSCWKLDPEELEVIARTGHIILAVWGKTHPPVAIYPRYGKDGSNEQIEPETNQPAEAEDEGEPRDDR